MPCLLESCSELNVITVYEKNMGLSPRQTCLQISEQQMGRPAYASAQSNQHLCYSILVMYHIKIKTSKLSICLLVSLTEQADFIMTWLKTLTTGFSSRGPCYLAVIGVIMGITISAGGFGLLSWNTTYCSSVVLLMLLKNNRKLCILVLQGSPEKWKCFLLISSFS